MYPQNLPTYTHKFLEYKDWIKNESDHYIFYYTAGSVAEKDIDFIIKTQEDTRIKIIDTLKLDDSDENLKKKITYYFYPNEELKTELMGDPWYAQSVVNEFIVHVLYTKEHKPIGPHEDTHLLVLSLGFPGPFIQEGLAEYMVGHAWDKKPHSEYVKDGLAKELNMYPSKYLTKEDWFNTDDDYAIYFYSLVAEWTKYLLDNFGLEKYKEFYTNLNRDTISEEMSGAYIKYFGRSINDLEVEFLKSYK